MSSIANEFGIGVTFGDMSRPNAARALHGRRSRRSQSARVAARAGGEDPRAKLPTDTRAPRPSARMKSDWVIEEGGRRDVGREEKRRGSQGTRRREHPDLQAPPRTLAIGQPVNRQTLVGQLPANSLAGAKAPIQIGVGVYEYRGGPDKKRDAVLRPELSNQLLNPRPEISPALLHKTCPHPPPPFPASAPPPLTAYVARRARIPSR